MPDPVFVEIPHHMPLARRHEVPIAHRLPVVVSALICGDGVDLVTDAGSGWSKTRQLTCFEARALAAALNAAADESERLTP